MGRNRSTWTEQRLRYAIDSYYAGVSTTLIAEALNLSRSSVVAKLNRMNIFVYARQRGESKRPDANGRWGGRPFTAKLEAMEIEGKARARQIEKRYAARGPNDRTCAVPGCNKARQPGRDYCHEHHHQFVVLPEIARRREADGRL